jgi:hypothetical protein
VGNMPTETPGTTWDIWRFPPDLMCLICMNSGTPPLGTITDFAHCFPSTIHSEFSHSLIGSPKWEAYVPFLVRISFGITSLANVF